jgi:TRAP-type C4-dicarboxylate transport system substrate-binding protein
VRPPTNPVAITANEFAADLYEASNKKEIKIEVFPSEILGTDKQMAEACAMKTPWTCPLTPTENHGLPMSPSWH